MQDMRHRNGDGGAQSPAVSPTDAIVIAMCKAHDADEAARLGEPSPWDEPFETEDDHAWRAERIESMRAAFDVAKDALIGQEAVKPGILVHHDTSRPSGRAKHHRITSEDLSEAMRRLSLSPKDLQFLTGSTLTSIRRWLDPAIGPKEGGDIPHLLASWLELLKLPGAMDRVWDFAHERLIAGNEGGGHGKPR